jgi:hypothetical protein
MENTYNIPNTKIFAFVYIGNANSEVNDCIWNVQWKDENGKDENVDVCDRMLTTMVQSFEIAGYFNLNKHASRLKAQRETEQFLSAPLRW